MTKVSLAAACLVFLSMGCAAAPSRPRNPEAAGATLTVAPPYHDPEYALRFTLPRPSEWDERYNVDGGEGAPDPILTLTHRRSGATIQVLFLPRAAGTPAELLERLKRAQGEDGATFTPVTAVPPGDDTSFEVTRAGTKTLHRILRLPGMTMSYVYFRVSAPLAAYVATLADFGVIRSSLAAVRTGPLSPRAALAQCLADKGVRLYGAWWCGPCHMQERLFGDGAARLDHVQCCASGETDQLPVCASAHVGSYPTWTFPDGSRLEGVQTLNDLADKAGCPRPPAE